MAVVKLLSIWWHRYVQPKSIKRYDYLKYFVSTLLTSLISVNKIYTNTQFLLKKIRYFKHFYVNKTSSATGVAFSEHKHSICQYKYSIIQREHQSISRSDLWHTLVQYKLLKQLPFFVKVLHSSSWRANYLKYYFFPKIK